jgi:glycosyltransferase involved in cell wall biosynthesis
MTMAALDELTTQNSQLKTTRAVTAIIPALNEADAIAEVVRGVRDAGVADVIVVDNGSDDDTATRAAAAGARVIREPRRGYGRACRAGVQAVPGGTGTVLFLDGDGSDDPRDIPGLVAPIAAGTHDFVIGSRTRGVREPGSLHASQLLAGRLAGLAMRVLYGVQYTDMCPLRAIRADALAALGMREETYGWNLEMQMRVAQAGLRILEMPVRHRHRRGGRSKVSGSVTGSLRAAGRLASTLVRLALASSSRTRPASSHRARARGTDRV